MADSSNVTAGVNATATQYNNLRKDLVLGQKVTGTDSYAATINVDWSDLTKGNVRTITLTGNAILTFSNPAVGQLLYLRIVQDATGSRLITSWPTGVIWTNATAPTLSTTANRIDTLAFMCTAATPAFDAGMVFPDLG